MDRIAGGETAEYVYIARRNNSLSSSGRLLVFGFTFLVSVGIAAAFSLIFGAWPILPFAGIEMGVLFFALRYIDRHAADYERITIQGDRVTVDVRAGAESSRFELNRYWAQVVCEGSRLALRSHGLEIELGRHVCDGERREMARDLARGLQGSESRGRVSNS
jgi:uncharacterized membrane protein